MTPTEQDMEERAAFEKWYEESNHLRSWEGLQPPDIFKLDAEGNYTWDVVHISWEAWQGATPEAAAMHEIINSALAIITGVQPSEIEGRSTIANRRIKRLADALALYNARKIQPPNTDKNQPENVERLNLAIISVLCNVEPNGEKLSQIQNYRLKELADSWRDFRYPQTNNGMK